MLALFSVAEDKLMFLLSRDGGVTAVFVVE
jgi:hypothetical protein